MMNRAATILSCVAVLVVLGCQGETRQGTLYSIGPGRELVTYLPADLNAVHEAAVEVINELGYSVEKDAVDAREAAVTGRTALEHPVRVKMYKHGPKMTKIEVHVGGKNPEAASREVLDMIETRLE